MIRFVLLSVYTIYGAIFYLISRNGEKEKTNRLLDVLHKTQRTNTNI